MQPSPPQWPDQSGPTPGGKAPQSRTTVVLGAVAIVSAVLIVALIGTLIVVLSRSAQSGTTVGQLQSGPAATSSVTATQGVEQPTSTTGTPQTGSGGNSTPVPTSSGNHTSPTATPNTVKPSVHQIIRQLTSPDTSIGHDVATCPTGEIALSGSWGISGDPTAYPYGSYRSGLDGWAGDVVHVSTTVITTYVECLKNAPGATIYQDVERVTVAPGSTASVIANYGAGGVVVGGAFFDTGLPGQELYYFTELSSTEWIGSFNN